VLPDTPYVSKHDTASGELDPQRKRLEEWQKATGRLRSKTPLPQKKPLTLPQAPQISQSTRKQVPKKPENNIKVEPKPIVQTQLQSQLLVEPPKKSQLCVKEEPKEIDYDLSEEFLERFYPRMKPESDLEDYYIKCKEAITFDYKKSKEFFCKLMDDPNCDLKKHAFLWLCFAESLYHLGSYKGVEGALCKALKLHAEPFDVLFEYIQDYFPRKCAHTAKHLRVCLNTQDCSNVPNNTNTLTSGLFDDCTPAHVFNFDPEYDTPSSTNSIESMRNRHNIILVTPSKLSNNPIGTPQRVPIESILPTQEMIIRNLENSFTNTTQSDTSLPSEPEDELENEFPDEDEDTRKS